MGPLCAAWEMVDKMKSQSNKGSKEVHINVGKLSEFLDQTVMLAGQARNAIAHYRRRHFLAALSKDDNKAEELTRLCKDSVESETKFLFGDKAKKLLKNEAKDEGYSKLGPFLTNRGSYRRYKPF